MDRDVSIRGATAARSIAPGVGGGRQSIISVLRGVPDWLLGHGDPVWIEEIKTDARTAATRLATDVDWRSVSISGGHGHQTIL